LSLLAGQTSLLRILLVVPRHGFGGRRNVSTAEKNDPLKLSSRQFDTSPTVRHILKMGTGRRLGKKQGIPEPLENFLSKKRKDAPAAARQERGSKRRKSNDDFEVGSRKFGHTQSSKSAVKKGVPIGFVNGKKQANGERISKKSKKQPSPELDIEDEDSDIADLSGDAIDDPDIMEDELGDVNVEDLDAMSGDSAEEEFNLENELAESDEPVDSDTEARQGLWSDDEGEDAEERLNAANIEGLSRRLDMQKAEDEARAQAELEEAGIHTNIEGDRPKILGEDSDEDEAAPQRLAPDLQLLRTRITETIRVLDDFSKLAEPGRSRTDYTSQLLKDICAYYGYSPFLAEKLFNLFPPREAFAFFEANETPRPLVIRTNTLRTHRRELAQSLINRGVTLEPVGKWSKVGLQIFEAQVPLGATPEYLAGHYILQAASSFLPVMALAPQENERILDMAAAPGGKTTYISALMRNTGVVFANDANKARAKSLIGNIHRMGVKNTIVCNYSALEFPRVMGGFDRVLLDAPCSGTGVISKDPSVKTNKTEKDFLKLPYMQKQLLLHAIDSTDHASKTGGYIIYSTCSVTIEENEMVVQYTLDKRPNVKLVPTGLPFGREGFTNIGGKVFHPSMRETRRYYPQAYNMDGFFVAKFKKTGPTKAGATAGIATADSDVNAKDKNADSGVEVDKSPIVEEGKEDDFGGWDESEDEKYMEKARKAALRKKGRDPRTLDRGKVKSRAR